MNSFFQYYQFYHCAIYQYHDDEGNTYKDYEAFTSLEACNLYIQAIKAEMSNVKLYGESSDFTNYDNCYYERVRCDDFEEFDSYFDDNDSPDIVIKKLHLNFTNSKKGADNQ